MAEPAESLTADVVHGSVASVAQSVSGAVDRSIDVASRARFIEAVAKSPAASRRKPWRVLAIAASIVAAVSTGELVRRSRRGAPEAPASLLAVGQAIHSDTRALELSISDGSRITALPSTEARVLASDAHGANIELRHGALVLDVRHRPETRWSIVAGAVRVQVTGTRFEARRSAADESVDVHLFEGSLRVTIDERRVVEMRSGQRLHVDGARGEHVEIDDPRPVASDASAPSLAARAEDASAAAVASSADASEQDPRARSARRQPESSAVAWHLLVLQGEFAAVLREARASEGDLSSRSVDELVALAEAGRHEGDLAWTETAYDAIRDRHFARTHDRAEAVFACARTAEDAADLGRAVEWYRRYETDFPDGRRAAESIGRQFVIEQRRGRIARAQELARRYLIREGGGPFAARAHSLLSD
ncbi:MAG: FecR family protein [Polyangiales bacterium]